MIKGTSGEKDTELTKTSEGINVKADEELTITVSTEENEVEVQKTTVDVKEGSVDIQIGDEGTIFDDVCINHVWGSDTIIKEASCKETGLKKRKCSICNQEETEEIPKTDHTFGDWTIVKEATTTEEGQKKRTCTVCCYEETEVVPKTSSDPSGDPTPSDGSFKINATTFPDKAFRDCVSKNFDTNKDGTLSSAEVKKVTEISVNNLGISSLKGVEIFTNLGKLNCSLNNIKELDISKNTKLYNLNCISDQLKSLDISHNPVLLSCYRSGLIEMLSIIHIQFRSEKGSLLINKSVKIIPSYIRTNPMKPMVKVATFKYAKVKKKAQSFKINKYVKAVKAQGKVTYTKVKGNKKITINSKTGKAKIKKGLKKGKYKIKVKVTAAGNAYFKPISKVVTLTVKIK